MSYTVIIVNAPLPSVDKAAWETVDKLIEEEGTRLEIFQKRHDQLTVKFPCMCSVPDDQIGDTAWNGGTLLHNFLHRAAVLGISYSRVDEVLPFLIKTTNALGLVVFDEQTGTVRRG